MSLFPIQPGSVKTFASLTIPTSSTKFGTHFSHFGIGGYVEVPTIAFRDAIPIGSEMNADKLSSGRRKLGMVVYVYNEQKFYQLLPKHSATSGGTPGALVTLTQWNAASNAQRMVWLDSTKTRMDIDGAAPTYALINGSGVANDSWSDVTPALNSAFNSLSSNWQSAYLTVSSLSANWQTTYTTVCTNSASWDQTRLDLSNYLPLTGGTIDGNLSIHGNFFVTGSSALISAVNLIVNDPLIYLAADNPSDSLDIGIVGSFTEAPIGYQHTGLVRLHDTNEWSLFSGLTTEPASATAISRTDPTFTIDTLNANLKGNLLQNTNVFGYLSSNDVVYAKGGDSDKWNSTYTSVCSNSAKWETAFDSITGNILQKGNSFGEAVVIGSNDAYSLVLETSGIPRMTILSGGNVGIGNSNPNNALTVSGDISANNIKLTTATASTSGILFGTDTNLYRAGANLLATDDAFRPSLNANTISNEVVVARTTATTNTLEKRNINTQVWNTTAVFLTGDATLSLSQHYIPKAVNSASLRNSQIYDDGTNVGVGTTAPNEKLTVAGSISASDYIYQRTKLKLVTETYSFSAEDQNAMVLFSSTTPVSAIVPNDTQVAFGIGATVNFATLNAVVFVTGAPGVTIRAADDRNYLRATNSTATVMKIGANEWLLFGDIWGDNV